MKKTKLLRGISFILAGIVMALSCFSSTAIEASTYPERVVKLLVVYDDTFDVAMENMNLDGEAAHRLEQAMKLAAVPFKQKWNITLDVTVKSFHEIFIGQPYVNECPQIHSWVSDEAEKSVKEIWNLDGQCCCFPEDQCYTSSSVYAHHTSASKLAHEAHNYAQLSQQYDAVEFVVGHKLCYYSNSTSTHKECLGMSVVNGYGHVIRGTRDFDSNESTFFSNLLSIRGLLWHEFSHNFGLRDGSSDFTNPNNCSENHPCTMSGGFSGVVYANNVWCPNCCSRFNYDMMGSLAGCEN